MLAAPNGKAHPQRRLLLTTIQSLPVDAENRDTTSTGRRCRVRRRLGGASSNILISPSVVFKLVLGIHDGLQIQLASQLFHRLCQLGTASDAIGPGVDPFAVDVVAVDFIT